MKRFFLIITIFLLVGCSQSTIDNRQSTILSPQSTIDNRQSTIEITYWQYWTGFEGKAIEKLVKRFNDTHSDIKVKMLTISEPRKKTLLSIIGGTPPDVISSIAAWVPELANKGAILPLDDFLKENMITKDLFMPVFWEMLTLYGHIWALPTTPTSTALYWNKNLFKEAGLNPDIPPKTLEELEIFSEKLTKRNPNGEIKQIGFLSSWPPWSFSFYGILFGGTWGDKEGNSISANHPKNIESWIWAQNLVRKLGGKNIQLFQEGCGNYQGVNNPFYSGKIAIESNGVWEGNFIKQFAPNLDFGAAPMPSKSGEPTTIVDCDCILIPKGSKHPKEAFEFITWLMKPENLEELCASQAKFSPLIISNREDFIKKHPNPYIKVFIDLAKSENAQFFPQSVFYEQYRRELKRTFEAVIRLKKDPKEGLDEVQKKMEREL